MMLPAEEQRIVDIVREYTEPLQNQINELRQEVKILHRVLGREINDNRRQSQYSSEELMGLERFRQTLIENSESDLGKFKMRMLDNEELKVIEHALNTNFSDTPTSLEDSKEEKDLNTHK